MARSDKRTGTERDGKGRRMIATNRRARHEYHIDKTWEAGLVLHGTEVKSLREGRASLAEAYAAPEGGEIWLHDLHIPPYTHGNRFNDEPKRSRKLLLRRDEINKLMGSASQTGYTLVPLKLYFNERNRVKLELALCRGKRAYDKRQAIRERDIKREQDREMRDARRRN